MNFYCVEADPEDWGLVAILPSLHICLTLQRSLTSHPRQAFGTDSKCPDVLLTAPLFHIPFGKQHDNYSGMHFCEPFRGFVFRLKEGGGPPTTLADVPQQIHVVRCYYTLVQEEEESMEEVGMFV